VKKSRNCFFIVPWHAVRVKENFAESARSAFPLPSIYGVAVQVLGIAQMPDELHEPAGAGPVAACRPPGLAAETGPVVW
jgi:hypothetical protein